MTECDKLCGGLGNSLLIAREKGVKGFQIIVMTQVLFRKLILEEKLDGKKTNKKKRCVII